MAHLGMLKNIMWHCCEDLVPNVILPKQNHVGLVQKISSRKGGVDLSIVKCPQSKYRHEDKCRCQCHQCMQHAALLQQLWQQALRQRTGTSPHCSDHPFLPFPFSPPGKNIEHMSSSDRFHLKPTGEKTRKASFQQMDLNKPSTPNKVYLMDVFGG